MTERGEERKPGGEQKVPGPEAVLEHLARTEKQRFSELMDALTDGSPEAGTRLRSILFSLLRQKRIAVAGKKYSLLPEADENAVCDFLRRRGPARASALIRHFGLNDTARRENLTKLLRGLQRRGIIRLQRGQYALVRPRLETGELLQHFSLEGDTDRESLVRRFGLRSREDLARLDSLLDRLCDEGHLRPEGDRFVYLPDTTEISGVFLPDHGFSFLRLDSGSLLRLSGGSLGLLPGDRVLARLDRNRRTAGRLPLAEPVRVLIPTGTPLLLRVNPKERRDGPRQDRTCSLEDSSLTSPLTLDSFLVRACPVPLEENDVVLARILDRHDRDAEVEVLERLIAFNTVQEHERLVKLNHEVPGVFPDNALREAAELPADPDPADLAGCADLRDLPFVTMDGEDARDFDDAVCVERDGEGWLLRVAIADVSRYVRPGSALDREASARGFSRYFPVSVEPMLPPALSDGLCSLLPGRARPVLWTALRLDARGRRLSASFGEGVIRSRARLTYDQAKALTLDEDPRALSDFAAGREDHETVLAMLREALALSRRLRELRMIRGALDFDLPEPRADFDETGHIVSLERAPRHEMHRLIEEFMLAANEAVAGWLESTGFPFLFRVHPDPEPEKMRILADQLALLGLRLPKFREGHPFPFQEALAQAAGGGSAFLVHRLCVRALEKARYSAEAGGHFALASRAYCHFTSPIRRYADLLVHRAFRLALGRGAGPVPAGRRLERTADRLNALERAVRLCEDEMNTRLSCLWLAARPAGSRWTGTITERRRFDCAVALDEAPVEGRAEVPEALPGQSGRGFVPGARCSLRLLRLDSLSLRIQFQVRLLGGARDRRR